MVPLLGLCIFIVVLSRNPIRKLGNSLAKMKSIAKVSSLSDVNWVQSNIVPEHPVSQAVLTIYDKFQISLSNCQLEDIDSSIKACAGLEQLRLAHNDIKVYVRLSISSWVSIHPYIVCLFVSS